MAQLYENAIFWIEVEKISPNPYQPRREFNEAALRELADSIRQYGILQPLTVSRVEREIPDGGLVVEYELIAGERRLRASKLAGLREVPVVIRVGDDNKTKLELAIIENLQREDLNAVDRARAFMQLHTEFGFTHTQIAQKIGKSREYVSNTLRILQLPQEILEALSAGKISEGHTRPIMMLNDRPEEQNVLFKEILFKKVTVREAERIARRIAVDKVRRKDLLPDPEVMELEQKLQDVLGTRVHIERKENGGRVMIDFFSNEDLHSILEHLKSENQSGQNTNPNAFLERHIARQSEEIVSPPTSQQEPVPAVQPLELESFKSDVDAIPVSQPVEISAPVVSQNEETVSVIEKPSTAEDVATELAMLDDRSKDEIEKSEQDTDLYNIKNFSI